MILICNYRKYCKSDTKKTGLAGGKVLTGVCMDNTIFCKKCKKGGRGIVILQKEIPFCMMRRSGNLLQ